MRKKELVDKVATEFSIKSGRSRKIVDYILCQLVDAGLSEEGFYSPIVKLRSHNIPQHTVNTPEGGTRVVSAKRVTKMIPAKDYVSASSSKAV